MKNKYIAQYWFENDWLGRKSKVFYFGAKLDWAKEIKNEPRKIKRRNTKRRRDKV
tara:strand:- start:1256 stop:1420 length:165 start_codon:yes stop_codon:yes gene_type:complete